MVNCGDNTQQTGADSLGYNYQEKANTKYKISYPSKMNMESRKTVSDDSKSCSSDKCQDNVKDDYEEFKWNYLINVPDSV